MIETRLHILMGHKKIKSIRQLSEETGITRLSLTKLYDGDAKGIEFNTIDRLCAFFDCGIGDILVYIKDQEGK